MYNFDTLFRDYLANCEKTGLTGTLDAFITDCITLCQDEDDPVFFWVANYVSERNQSEPGWQETYSLPE